MTVQRFIFIVGGLITALAICIASGRMLIIAMPNEPNAVSVEFHSNMHIRLVDQTMAQSQSDPNQLIITTKLQITEESYSSRTPGG